MIFIDIAGAEPGGMIFHLHGGGFALGSARGSVGLASGLARKSGLRAVSVDYRLAPEHPYPAALQDATAAYRTLLDQADSPGHVVVSGESAGGNLAIELLIAGKAEGLPMPAAALLFSPMTDLTVTGNSYASKARVDPNISAKAIRTRAADYLAGTDPADPLVSPIFADLTGPAAAADPGRIARGAPRRRHPARGQGRSRRRRRHPGHHPRCPARVPGVCRPPRRGRRRPQPGGPIHQGQHRPAGRRLTRRLALVEVEAYRGTPPELSVTRPPATA